MSSGNVMSNGLRKQELLQIWSLDFSISTVRKIIHIYGKHSRQLPEFPGEDVPAGLPQEQVSVHGLLLERFPVGRRDQSGIALPLNSHHVCKSQIQHVCRNTSYALSSMAVEG